MASDSNNNNKMEEWAVGELGMLKQSCAQLSNDVRDLVLGQASDFERVRELSLLACAQALRERDEAIRMLKVEESRRRSYLAQLLEIKGNIRVLCRIRPVNRTDESKGSTKLCVQRTSRETVRCDNRDFEFDEVFPPTSTNAHVFDEALPMVESVFEGHHACIFAYGQTGSGKTHTMTGNSEDRGVNFRAVDLLFERKRQMLNSGAFSQVLFKISNVEIYNESVRDLLANAKELQIRQDLYKGVHLPDCTLVNADDVDTIWKTMELGQRNRAQALTKMNSESSRSHSIFMIDVYVEEQGNTGLARSGKLILVDLAGSERPNKSEVSGERLKEAAAINKSLSVLGKVIASLGAKSQHVPFRDSKLTYLLQDSMGAQNKVMMIVQTAPTMFNVQESMCTLLFGSNARAVQLGRAEARPARAAAPLLVVPPPAPAPPSKQQQQQNHELQMEKCQLQQKLLATERQLAEALARAERAERCAQQQGGVANPPAVLEQNRASQPHYLQPIQNQRRSSIVARTSQPATRMVSAPSIQQQQQQQPLPRLSHSSFATSNRPQQQPLQGRSFGTQVERFPSTTLTNVRRAPPAIRPRDENVQPEFGLKRRESLLTARHKLQDQLPQISEHTGGGGHEEEEDSFTTPMLPAPPPLSSSSTRSVSSMRSLDYSQRQQPLLTYSASSSTMAMTPLSNHNGSETRIRRVVDEPALSFMGSGPSRSMRMTTFGGGPSRVVGHRRA